MASLPGAPTIAFGQEIIKYLLLLKNDIKKCFFNDGNAQACTYNWKPLTVKRENLPVETGEQQLIDLQCAECAQEKFKNHKLAKFWLDTSLSYPALEKNAIPQLLIFPTTRECEQEFSTFLTIKSKTRNRLLNSKHNFRCSVSKISPRLAKLVEEKQAQPLH